MYSLNAVVWITVTTVQLYALHVTIAQIPSVVRHVSLVLRPIAFNAKPTTPSVQDAVPPGSPTPPDTAVLWTTAWTAQPIVPSALAAEVDLEDPLVIHALKKTVKPAPI